MNKNLYLITGTDILEREERLEKIQEDFGEKIKGINYIVLDKDSVKTLESEINTYAFGYATKLIIVKFDKKEKAEKEESDSDAAEEKVDWLTPELEESLKTLTDVTVVFYGEFMKRSKIYKLVEKCGECIVCDQKKEYDIMTWCAKMFKEQGVEITNTDINYLISLAGIDKLVLKNEIEKLCTYAIDTKKITKEEIDNLSIRTSDVIIFDLTDSIGTKNIKGALKSLNELIENKEPIQKIVIMIAKHFKSLLVAKVAMMENRNVMDELATKSPYACNKYKSQAKLFSFDELKEKIRDLAKLDIDSKTGLIDLKVGLERIIAKS